MFLHSTREVTSFAFTSSDKFDLIHLGSFQTVSQYLDLMAYYLGSEYESLMVEIPFPDHVLSEGSLSTRFDQSPSHEATEYSVLYSDEPQTEFQELTRQSSFEEPSRPSSSFEGPTLPNSSLESTPPSTFEEPTLPSVSTEESTPQCLLEGQDQPSPNAERFIIGNPEDFIQAWFTSNSNFAIEDIWRFSLSSDNSWNQARDINHFLPISPDVQQWLEKMSYKDANLSVSLMSFFYNQASVLPLGNWSTRTNNSGQKFAIILRFYSFCQQVNNLLGTPAKLSANFCRCIEDKKMVIGFCLLLLLLGRCAKTIGHYSHALKRMHQFLLQAKIVQKTDAMDEVGNLLQLILTARNIKDQDVRLKNRIEQTEQIDAFDAEQLKPLSSVPNVEKIVNEFSETVQSSFALKRLIFYLVQGCIAHLIRFFNGSHNIDLVGLTISAVSNGLEKAERTGNPLIIFDAVRRFKNSSKKNVILKLSVPARYSEALKRFVEARKQLKNVQKNEQALFLTHKGQAANKDNIVCFIRNYFKSFGLKDVGANMNRHMIVTQAQTELEKMRSSSVAMQNCERAMENFPGSLIHSAEMAQRHYNHPVDQQAAFRTSLIDSSVFGGDNVGSEEFHPQASYANSSDVSVHSESEPHSSSSTFQEEENSSIASSHVETDSPSASSSVLNSYSDDDSSNSRDTVSPGISEIEMQNDEMSESMAPSATILSDSEPEMDISGSHTEDVLHPSSAANEESSSSRSAEEFGR